MLSVSKYVVMYLNLKSTFFKIINQQQNIFTIFYSNINLDEHVSMKVNIFTLERGSGSQRNTKESKEMDCSPLR